MRDSRFDPMMHDKALTVSLCLALIVIATSCRGVRLRENESDLEKLESRVSALEAKVEALSRR